uniref:VWFD domain-containing protein n=1 Tax=Haemonchus placei TaxID=6290 RepID=A0A0N4WR53_HAEPC
MCSYVHPQEVPYSNYFMRVKVGYSHFVRARVSPGTTSVLETETNMLEPHSVRLQLSNPFHSLFFLFPIHHSHVFFDALEWQSGTRLIGCCTNRIGIRQCPFATPVEAGVLLWQSASFDCPALTVKISFICENFGVEDGECGLDSVRLHRLSDTFLLEPCQKNVLSSL